MVYQVRVVGVTAENRQKILKAISGHPMLNSSALGFTLVPEPENPYDKKAVAVYVGKKYIVGYIPKGHVLQDKVHDGELFVVRGVVVGGYDGRNYGLILNCENGEDEEVEISNVR